MVCWIKATPKRTKALSSGFLPLFLTHTRAPCLSLCYSIFCQVCCHLKTTPPLPPNLFLPLSLSPLQSPSPAPAPQTCPALSPSHHLLSLSPFFFSPKLHCRRHRQPKRRRLASPSGGRHDNSARQRLVGDGLDELQHSFRLKHDHVITTHTASKVNTV